MARGRRVVRAVIVRMLRAVADLLLTLWDHVGIVDVIEFVVALLLNPW